MKLVILESPYAAQPNSTVDDHIVYARECLRDSLLRGECPIASHLLYTQRGVLDDTIPDERTLGIDAGLAWRDVAEGSVIYTDFGITKGMEYGITRHRNAGKTIIFRKIRN